MSGAAFVVLLSAAIIMDGISSAPYCNSSFNWNQLHGGEKTGSVRQVLVHLDKERQDVQTQNQINEEKLAQLKEVLEAMRRQRDDALQERDEAVEQLHILRHHLSQQAYHNNMNSNPRIGSSPLTLDAIPVQSSSRSLLVDEHVWDWPADQQDDFQQPAPSSFIDHDVQCSNLAEKETMFQHPDNDRQGLTFLTHHDPDQQQRADHSSLQRLVEDSMSGHDSWQQQHAAVTHTSEHHMLGISETRAHGHGHMAYSSQILTPNDSNRSLSFHLPEPPEADPDIMLSTLPERGKFMQAIIDAGPLLQTLFVAGSLPRWRHPPTHSMDAVEMPMLSIRSPSPPLQLGHIQPYQSNPLLSMSSPSPPLQLGHMQLRNSPTPEPPLHVATPVSSSAADASVRIKDTHAFSSPTSKLICCPIMNSQDTAFTGRPLKFAKIH